jgi:transcriptional regulator with XRE-family HTH domain
VGTEQHDRGASRGPGSGPTVLRILLGAQLRRLREARGISREEAGYLIRASESKISRMELGRVSFKERDVADLLSLYGITRQDEREALLVLARQANTPGWWQRYGDVLPSWFQTYLGLEEAATQPPPARSNGGSACGCNASSCSPAQAPRNCGRWWTRRRCGGRSAGRR